MDILELDAQVFADNLAARENADIFEHGLAAIAETGRLYRGDVQGAAKFVDDQRRQRFAFNILGDDQHRLAHLRDLLEQWQQVFHRTDLLFMDQD